MSANPVLITGMHRSGTSLVANLLRNCGLYLGHREDMIQPDELDNPAGYWEYADAVGFSDRLLVSLGASWDQVGSIKSGNVLEKLDSTESKAQALELFQPLINSEKLWGWKDPRGTLLLPFWKDLFPGLKVVVCLRNPIEVAFSLSKRDYLHVDFPDGLSLWRDYGEILDANLQGIEYIVTHYEAVMHSPQEEMRRLCEFLGLDPSPEEILQAVGKIQVELYRGVATDHLLRNYPALPENLLGYYDRFVSKAGEGYQRLMMDTSFQEEVNQSVLQKLYPLVTRKFDRDYRKIIERTEERDVFKNEVEQLSQDLLLVEQLRQDLVSLEDEHSKQVKLITQLNMELSSSSDEITDLRDELKQVPILEDKYNQALAKINFYEVELSKLKQKNQKSLKGALKKMSDQVRTRVFRWVLIIGKKMFPEGSGSKRLLRKIFRKLVQQFEKKPVLFDADYYLEKNVDVAEAGVNPFFHYRSQGYREGRKPHPLFDPNWYLSQNQDVLEANFEPFTHYLKHGWKEGRNPHFLFDTQFYLHQNPDVYESGLDPLTHYWIYGWKEGRDPHPSFDLRQYLSLHPELIDLGINPLVHYIGSGSDLIAEQGDLVAGEGIPHQTSKALLTPKSTPETKLRPLVRQLRNLVSIEDRLLTISHKKPKSILDVEELTTAIQKHLLGNGMVVSLSQDNYIENVGGVQIFVWDEQAVLNQDCIDYVHLSPVYSKPRLAYENEENHIRVIVNGKRVGFSTSEKTLDALANFGQEKILKLVVHHMLGFNPEWVTELISSLGKHRAEFWLHDNFSICPGYTLLRNDVTFCDAPPVDSNSCRLCVYGAERINHHAPAIRALFEQNEITVFAPSEFTLQLWKEKGGLPYAHAEVLEHASLEVNPPELGGEIIEHRPIKIAYLGNPIFYKGWEQWKRLILEFSGDDRFEFFHFGLNTDHSLPQHFKRVMVSKEDRFAMVDTLKDHDIDVCFLWSICPESFSFTLYESMAAGCYILAHKDSGNIQFTVRQREVGEIFDSLDQLIKRMQSETFVQDIYDYRYPRKHSALKLRLFESLRENS